MTLGQKPGRNGGCSRIERGSKRGRTRVTGGGIGVERVVGDKVGRLILRRGEQKDPRASRPRRRKPGTRKTPPSHVDHPLPPYPPSRFSIVLLSLLSTHTMANTDLADAFIHLFRDEPSPSTKKETSKRKNLRYTLSLQQWVINQRQSVGRELSACTCMDVITNTSAFTLL